MDIAPHLFFRKHFEKPVTPQEERSRVVFQMHYDCELGEEIHHAIEKEEGISVPSKNIQVLVENGRVTLKGEVFMYEEKMILEGCAADYAGVKNVVNQLEVIEEME